MTYRICAGPLWLLLAAVACASAAAQDMRGQSGTAAGSSRSPGQAPQHAAVPDETGASSAATPPARPATKPPPRRPLRQIIDGASLPTVLDGYRPTLNPRAPATVAPSPGRSATAPATVPSAALPPPAQINSCQGGQCSDAAGARYQGGVGNASVNSQGRLCNRSGTTVQCF
jgi:hypothetical protein